MLAIGITVCILQGTAAAVDVPVPGRSLSLRSKNGRETLAIRLSDPAIPLVASGPDDPSVAGLSLELFSAGPFPQASTLFVPSGVGDPGWTVQGDGRYRYKNDAAPGPPSPVRKVGVRTGKIQLTARNIGLTLDGARASIGVRIKIGDLRVCALFAGASVRLDETGRFTARNAVVAPQDCSNEALGACGGPCPPGTACTGTNCYPVPCDAGGFCPIGATCVHFGVHQLCGPAPCSGGTGYPTCDGTCALGLTCTPFVQDGGGCSCAP
jgi:hypothetical protein